MRFAPILAMTLVLSAVFAAAGATGPTRPALADSGKARPADTALHAQAAKPDSAFSGKVSAPPAPAPADSSRSRLSDSSRHRVAAPDSLRSAGRLSDTLQRKETKKIKLQKQKYGHHQVMLAVFMMVFVIGMVTMAQQWNPR